VAELEERHTLLDQPGKLKLLYWLTRGNLGTYLDAIGLGAATGQTPSTGAVRSFRTKGGAGLNFEQQLAPDLGVFARASVSQGTVEEVDFTDINQSISAGFSLTGSRWGRPDDTVGLAGAANRISHQGKLYLAAGGLGGIIGDGQLPNAGPEQILEAYYRVAVFSFAHFAFHYQYGSGDRQGVQALRGDLREIPDRAELGGRPQPRSLSDGPPGVLVLPGSDPVEERVR
jgi:high affinity Mn2+ porin